MPGPQFTYLLKQKKEAMDWSIFQPYRVTFSYKVSCFSMEWHICDQELSEIGCGGFFRCCRSDFDSLCVTENLRYMSLFFCFNRYKSEHISEPFCADWGDRSSSGPLSRTELAQLHCGGRHGPAHQLWRSPGLLGLFDKHTEPQFSHLLREVQWFSQSHTAH